MFASRINNVQPSETKQFKPLIQEIESNGGKVYKFDHGDVNISLPNSILSRMGQYFQTPKKYKYASSQGENALLSYIAKKHDVNKDNVVLSVGAKQALMTLSLMLYDDQDDVVVLAPYWSTYKSQIEVMGAHCHVFYDAYPEVNEQKLRSFVYNLKKPRAILINNPNNPSGKVYSAQEIERVLRVAQQHNMLVIADEVYGDLVFSSVDEFVSVRAVAKGLGLEELVYVVSSPSKSHGMSGFRVGYIVANQEFVKKCISVNSQTISNVPVFSQEIWYDVVTDKGFQKEYLQELSQRYSLAYEMLSESNLFEIPTHQASIYLFPKLPKLTLTDTEYCLHMIKKCGVALLPGSAFGVPGHIRFSVGNTSLDDLRKGIELLITETNVLLTLDNGKL